MTQIVQSYRNLDLVYVFLVFTMSDLGDKIVCIL